MAQASGYVEEIIYQNEETGYSVIELRGEEGNTTVVGILPLVSAGEYLTVEGNMTTHSIYGEQLKAERFEVRRPVTSESALRYLSSGSIKGVGPALAMRIVKAFGDDTFRILEEEPERLAEVKGISVNSAMKISAQAIEKKELRSAMLFLTQYGISPNLSVRIYRRYGEALYTIIRQNPYKLAEDIQGVGFRTADAIAVRIGIRPDSEYRIRSGLLYVLGQSVAEGHCCLPMNELVAQASEILDEVQTQEIQAQADNLVMENRLIFRRDEDLVYLPYYFHMEMASARMLLDLAGKLPSDPARVKRTIAEIEEESGIELDELQRAAVQAAAESGLVMITGGPGTGKTTTIRAILRYFEKTGIEYMLAAPTGRAARRMKEATGCEASTIHRLLEVSGAPEEETVTKFERNESNPLEAEAVIIDEMSMVDIHLMHALLRAILPGTRLILVGDENQLPSVGPGKVLKDMLNSGSFPVVRLARIFRQALESDIIKNAHAIHNGEEIRLDAPSRDFLFIRRPDADSVVRAVIALITEKLPGYVHADISEIQVMTPMKKGTLGVENLNRVLQESLNPGRAGRKEKELGGRIFREGDKVMQIRNDYQLEWEIRSPLGILEEKGKGVFNGDIGRIVSINDFAEEVEVEFEEGRRVIYLYRQCDELEHAYAITVHKSQGSEYPAVVIPLFSGPRMLMNNNLIYTAVTRAKSCVCLVGDPRCFGAMVRNREEQKRYTGLCARIVEMRKNDQRRNEI